MKTFKDLEFNDINGIFAKTQATMFFDNGYGVSVITGGYGSDSKPYELAVLFGDQYDNRLCYNTEITDDVIGWLTEFDVTELMIKVQKLKQ